MKAKHTPVPWKVTPNYPLIYHEETSGYNTKVADANTGHCCKDDCMANAAFIVRAVNAHEELVEALKQFMRCQSPDRQVTCRPNAADCEMGRRALAKAEGGEK